VPAIAQLDEFTEGEVLDVPGSPRLIHAPGHTRGHCALLLEERSLLFSGDALVTLNMTRGREGPRIIRGPVTEDADVALASLDVLAAPLGRRRFSRDTESRGLKTWRAQSTSRGRPS